MRHTFNTNLRTQDGSRLDSSPWALRTQWSGWTLEGSTHPSYPRPGTGCPTGSTDRNDLAATRRQKATIFGEVHWNHWTKRSHMIIFDHHWLVVSTPLKHISQWEGLSHILWKIKHVPNHQSDHNHCTIKIQMLTNRTASADRLTDESLYDSQEWPTSLEAYIIQKTFA